MRDGREHHRASAPDPVSGTPGQHQLPLAVDRNGELRDHLSNVRSNVKVRGSLPRQLAQNSVRYPASFAAE